MSELPYVPTHHAGCELCKGTELQSRLWIYAATARIGQAEISLLLNSARTGFTGSTNIVDLHGMCVGDVFECSHNDVHYISLASESIARLLFPGKSVLQAVGC